MIMSVSTLIILSGAATPSSTVNLSIFGLLERACAWPKPCHDGRSFRGQASPPQGRHACGAVFEPLTCDETGGGNVQGSHGRHRGRRPVAAEPVRRKRVKHAHQALRGWLMIPW